MTKKSSIDVEMAEVVDYSRLMGTFMPALRDVVERKFTADAATKKGIKVGPGELQKGADTFRHAKGLSSAKDTEAWMNFHGISLDTFEKFLEVNMLVAKFKDHLMQKTDKAKFLQHPEVKTLIRNLVYVNWLKKNFE